ncbi:hypothetical protein [Brevibacillus laterosporus]|uniref:Uncharacterized protein n=1 Tax=Brevibacillus laterosporus TaxID=1465 RepID=A0AAP3DJW7_BRELA|nr:hypothetical protein [Brevibacillus laterosporus]MCR8982273.1 hypothetical protein [Brevibacillus laterosporus]MCZ0809428.1 hypothetical protein [Brevibacillus laterosporus]MCZ0827857.1 hypothetical protein [Brevibacillus laterosporus]MCZ0851797.1 hypothetical protein [Brevibacillus laterosporus]
MSKLAKFALITQTLLTLTLLFTGVGLDQTEQAEKSRIIQYSHGPGI